MGKSLLVANRLIRSAGLAPAWLRRFHGAPWTGGLHYLGALKSIDKVLSLSRKRRAWDSALTPPWQCNLSDIRPEKDSACYRFSSLSFRIHSTGQKRSRSRRETAHGRCLRGHFENSGEERREVWCTDSVSAGGTGWGTERG